MGYLIRNINDIIKIYIYGEICNIFYNTALEFIWIN